MGQMNDFTLSPHFTFFEMTKTSNGQLQTINRHKALMYEERLVMVCKLLEEIRAGIGGPIHVYSGFRCPELNLATPGSSMRSQHMLGEAADMGLMDMSGKAMCEDFFRNVLEIILSQGLMFGQLIKETAKRPYGVSRWVHLSLGAPYREVYRCGQILEMEDGKYKLIKTVPVS